MASASLENLAEEGDTSGVRGDFAGSGVDMTIAPGTPFGPAGSSFASSASAVLSVDPSSRYFSFASMIIPSNDAFIGNDNPMAYEVFDGSGNFTPLTITVTGNQIWDGGTEVNDTSGAAFSSLSGDSTDEANLIAVHAGLDNFINTGTENGETIQFAFSADTAIARITIVPEPATVFLLMMAGFTVACVRQRRTGSRVGKLARP